MWERKPFIERKKNEMSECNHDCSSCSANCSERGQESFLKALNPYSSVKKVIAVVSGKGGVGKSLVTSLLASEMQRRGHSCAVLDADITGPSIPKSFGIKQHAMGTEEYLIPVTTTTGLQIMSINLILENETEPVVWRGPVIAGAVTQFWTDVLWRDVDYMFVDMPPRRAAHSVPVPAHRRCHHRYDAAGSGRHDRVQGGEHGRHDERAGSRDCGKHELLCLPGLWEEALNFRGQQGRAGREGVCDPLHRKDPHRPGDYGDGG